MLRRRVSVGGEPLERAEHPAEKAWTTRKTVERRKLGGNTRSPHTVQPFSPSPWRVSTRDSLRRSIVQVVESIKTRPSWSNSWMLLTQHCVLSYADAMCELPPGSSSDTSEEERHQNIFNGFLNIVTSFQRWAADRKRT